MVGLGLFLNRPGGSKFGGLAIALKDRGAQFYGAFWCPHCQEQKAEFGSSKKYLPYIECSNADNSQTQICKDNKIESYPTWKFKDGISINSQQEPVICEIKTKDSKESAICENRSSEYYKTWLFPDYPYAIKSPTVPIKEGNVWKFPSTAEVSGKISVEALAEQIQYTLPKVEVNSNVLAK